jgi:hypothetical protein
MENPSFCSMCGQWLAPEDGTVVVKPGAQPAILCESCAGTKAALRDSEKIRDVCGQLERETLSPHPRIAQTPHRGTIPFGRVSDTPETYFCNGGGNGPLSAA